MSQRMEIKQNAPSVIARLMGLEELPPHQPLHRQQKVLSDDYLRKIASIGQLEGNSLCVGRLSKRKAEKQDKQLCASGTSKIDKKIRWLISYEKENPSTVRAKFGFPGPKSSRAKCHSLNKKLNCTKGFDNMLDDYTATRDDLKRFSHHPDISIKQLADSKALRLHFHSGQFSASFPTSDHIETQVCSKPNKMMTQRAVLRSLQKLESQRESHIDHFEKLLKSQLELKDKSSYSSRRIVVLEPASPLLLSASDMLSQSGDQEYKEHGELKHQNGEINIGVPEIVSTATDMEPPGHSFNVIRGVAKKTRQEGKQNTGSNPRGSSRSRIPADESSANATDTLMISDQNSFECKGRGQVSYPFPSRLIFTTEAKKQIFERWKTTKNFQKVELPCGRFTLGEMLAMHDGGAGPKNLYSNIPKHGSSSPYRPQSENSEFGIPLHIGRKCGPKAEFIKNLQRSKHIENSSIASGSPNFTTLSDAPQNSRYWGQQEAIAEKRYKLKSRNSTKDVISDPRDLTANCEEHHSAVSDVDRNINQIIVAPKLSGCNVPCSGSDDNPHLQVIQVTQDELECNRDKKDIHNESDQRSTATVPYLSTEGLACRNLVANAESVEVSPENQLSEFAPCINLVKDGFASSDVWDSLTPQRALRDSPRGEIPKGTSDSDLSTNLDAINQHSPDSVLEPPFKAENTLYSECSNSPVADLSGLAMKLQLLDSELKGTKSETSGVAVSSDEDTDKGSLDLSRDYEKRHGALRPEENRDFSYLIDFLNEVFSCDSNLNLCHETWHAKECHISPSLFETLEKKYGKQTSWLKSERRLLFDRINSAVREILNCFMIFQISAKPLRRRFHVSLRRDKIEEELWGLLLSQEKEVSKDLSEKALGTEVKWLEFEEDTSLICKEMEDFLFNELVAELTSNECCS